MVLYIFLHHHCCVTMKNWTEQYIYEAEFMCHFFTNISYIFISNVEQWRGFRGRWKSIVLPFSRNATLKSVHHVCAIKRTIHRPNGQKIMTATDNHKMLTNKIAYITGFIARAHIILTFISDESWFTSYYFYDNIVIIQIRIYEHSSEVNAFDKISNCGYLLEWARKTIKNIYYRY